MNDEFKTFVIRNGGRFDPQGKIIGAVAINKQERILPSGAKFMQGSLGPIVQEASEPGSRGSLEARREFHVIRLMLLKAAFVRVKDIILGRASSMSWTWDESQLGVAPTGDGKGDLLLLKTLAAEHEAAIDSLDAELSRLPEIQAEQRRQRSLERAEAQARLAEAEFHNEVSQIEID